MQQQEMVLRMKSHSSPIKAFHASEMGKAMKRCSCSTKYTNNTRQTKKTMR